MAKWTVALFGHEKPHNLGWERRAMPGDFIHAKPFGEDWTENEKKEFLIVVIDGPTEEQLGALQEPIWDLDTYELYKPVDQPTFETMRLDALATRPDSQELINKFLASKDDEYQIYLQGLQMRCEMPKRGLKKRRFHIPLTDLKAMGVDEAKMLDKNLVYEPKLSVIDYTDITDKMLGRKILVTDGLNELQPLTETEMIAKATESVR